MNKYSIEAKDLLSSIELYEVKAGEKKDPPKEECMACTTCVLCAETCVAATN